MTSRSRSKGEEAAVARNDDFLYAGKGRRRGKKQHGHGKGQPTGRVPGAAKQRGSPSSGWTDQKTLALVTAAVVVTALCGWLVYAYLPTFLSSRGGSDSSTIQLQIAGTLSDEDLHAVAALTSREFIEASILPTLLLPRPVGSPNHKKVRQFIQGFMEDLGWHVELDAFKEDTPLGVKHFTNIIATFDTAATTRLSLAAHYDSKIIDGGEFVGATDSSVPCAVLLDLASTLTPFFERRQEKLGTTLQLIFFDGEEAFVEWTETDSIYGARHLAKKWSKTRVPKMRGKRHANMLQTMEALVLLDLLGAPNPQIRNAHTSTSHLFGHLVGLEERLRRENLLISAEQQQPDANAPARYFVPQINTHWRVEDDHVPFMRRNVPILHIISTPFPRVWHTLADTFDNIDMDTVVNWATIMRCFVYDYFQLPPERSL